MALTDSDRQQIIDALAAGETQHSLAKRFGCSSSTINKLAKRQSEHSPSKKEARSQRTANAVAAHVEYSRERQRLLVGKLLDLVDWTADQAAEKPIGPRDLQFLMTTVGIGIDKLAMLDESTKAGGGEILDLIETMRRDVQQADREAGALDS